jgi:hypothetical protein
VPPSDAVELTKGHPELHSEDFTALGQYEVYTSLFAGGRVTPYASARTIASSAPTSDPERLRQASRDRYGRALDEVEAGFADLLHKADEPPAPAGRRTRGPA